jgi:hypothetical protein
MGKNVSVVPTISWIESIQYQMLCKSLYSGGGCCGHMVVGFTTTYAITAYHY